MQSFLLRVPPTTEDSDSTHPFVTGLGRNIQIILYSSSVFKDAEVVGCSDYVLILISFLTVLLAGYLMVKKQPFQPSPIQQYYRGE